MKHNKLLTLSLLASFLILISASFSYAANSVTYGSADVCPMPAGAKVYIPVTVANDADLAALDIVGQTVTLSNGVTVKVNAVVFDNRLSDANVLDTRYPVDLVGTNFRFGAVKVAGVDLAVGSGRIATLECEFVSDCLLGSAGLQAATADFCGTSVSTAFVSAAAVAITPTVNGGAINVVNHAPSITFCPDDFEIYWNGGSVSVTLTADDPDLGCGCDALTFSLVSGIGQITAAGKYTYTGNRNDIGCNTVVVQVADEYGGTATCEFDVNVLNYAPIFSGFTAGTETIECGDTVFTSWDLDFHVFPIVTDPDLGPQALTYTLAGWTGGGNAPTIDPNTGELSWDPAFDSDYWGNHTVTVIVNDGAPLDECNPWNADTCSFVLHVVGFAVSVEKVHDAIQGHQTEVSVYLDSAMMGSWTYVEDFIGGFDILLAYDASALTFITAEPGDLLVDADWEYFTYRYGFQGNCGNACPSGFVRLVGLAETNNGAHHPGTITEPGELAKLTFRVTTDANFECQYAPISFYWFDCGDNALSDVTGRFLYVGDSVLFFEGTPYPEDTWAYGYDGAEPNCWDTLLIEAQPGYVKNFPLRTLLFRNGGIDIVCADSIDARGDVNLNGIPNEIADAVMYTLYFIEGLSAFGDPVAEPMRIEAAIAASDVNADGIRLSVADLVYLIRVITGDAQPYAKLVSGDMTLSSQVLGNEMTVRYTSGIDAGAALLVFDISGTVGTPRVGNGAAGMDVVSAVNGNELRVLVYNIGSAAITAGIDNVLMTVPVDGSITLRSVEVADFFGATMNVSTRELPSRYDVAQNYPNPFNPTTTIALSLPVAGEYHVAIYNVAGQLIRTFDGSASAGVVQLVWDGKDASGSTVASGMYFYKATVGDFTATKKMLLMK